MSNIRVLPPDDAMSTLAGSDPAQVVMLDPWYNKGVGGVRDDYDDWLAELVVAASKVGEHVFVWGFPEIVCKVLGRLPRDLSLVSWITWYYKNCPTVIKGWRSSQQACLHLAKDGAALYQENFFTDKQKELLVKGKLRYKPGPPNVIECPLNIGFIGKQEQTGHPAQKPEFVYEQLLKMTTKPGDVVIDPLCGSGTTGAVCRKLGVDAVLCDLDESYTAIVESRLCITRDQ